MKLIRRLYLCMAFELFFYHRRICVMVELILAFDQVVGTYFRFACACTIQVPKSRVS